MNNNAKVNFASCMIVEDHLKKVLGKTGGKAFKVSDNKNLPRAQHSAFGDFPNDYMPKRTTVVAPIKPLDAQEQSIAANGTGKSLFSPRASSEPQWAGPPQV